MHVPRNDPFAYTVCSVYYWERGKAPVVCEGYEDFETNLQDKMNNNDTEDNQPPH